jgi:beta-glucanase (GH16 family)
MVASRASIVVLACAACHSEGSGRPVDAVSPDSAIVPQGPTGRFNLVFDDEFDGNQVDTSKWNLAWPWSTPLNGGLQTYVAANATLSGGFLHLVATQQSAGGQPYSSGAVSTYQRFSFAYGVVESRFRVPAGKGFWPGFWMIYPTGVWPPEIDIIEILGPNPSVGFMTYHYLSGGNVASSNIPAAQSVDFSAGLHVFGIDWEAGEITWYIDGAPQGTFTDPTNVASQPMFILLNLDVGGAAGPFTPGMPDATTPFPSEITVDYVRVWQRAP